MWATEDAKAGIAGVVSGKRIARCPFGSPREQQQSGVEIGLVQRILVHEAREVAHGGDVAVVGVVIGPVGLIGPRIGLPGRIGAGVLGV